MDAIGFGMAEYLEQLMQSKDNFDLAFILEENTYRGETNVQLHVKDIKNGAV